MILVRVSLGEELVRLLLDLLDGGRLLALHALQRGHDVGHEHGELILADRLASVEIVKVEDELGLVVEVSMRHETERTHELIRVDGAVSIHIEHVHQHVDLSIGTLEELLESGLVETVIV